ncbi:MAG: amino acid ABC transporter permease [Spirochaetia bacterium]
MKNSIHPDGWKYFFYQKKGAPIPTPLFIFYTGIFFGLWTVFFLYNAQRLGNWHFASVVRYIKPLLIGYSTTLSLSIFVLALSCVLGLLLFFCQKSKLLICKVSSYWLIQLCRGTPLIVFIVFFYYIVAQALGLQNRIFCAVLILSCYHSTSISEIIRGGFQSIPKTQFQVAESFGLSFWQTYRYVIFPQLFQRVLPAMTNQIGIIVKDTSLVAVIGVAEFYQMSTNAANQTYASLEFFLILAIGYLLMTLPISILTKSLEKREEEMA